VGAPVAGLSTIDGAVRGLRLRDGGEVEVDACVAALPPRALEPLVPAELADRLALGRFETSPIVSAHLWLDRPVLEEPFVGLLGTTTHWLFDRSRLVPDAGGPCVSAVISAGREAAGWETSRVAATVLDDMRTLLPAARGAQLRHVVVVKERHATIAPTPEAERLRPPAETPLANLFLAGDWTATGLPPTIESAVLSGERAAAMVASRLGRC
jgi:predicted NAD/FAD-dependent oxidoreductase